MKYNIRLALFFTLIGGGCFLSFYVQKVVAGFQLPLQ